MIRIPTDMWSHVVSADNSAECTSLLDCLNMSFGGPLWLRLERSQWSNLESTPVKLAVEEERETFLLSVMIPTEPILPFEPG